MKDIKQQDENIKEIVSHIIKDAEAHPVATGVGTVGGAVAGAAMGMMGGPIGILIGIITGGALGSVAGIAGGEMINHENEDEYWRENFNQTAYYNPAFEYERDYRAAYAIGYALRPTYPKGTSFEDVELDLQERWEDIKDQSRLSWLGAREAIKDAWNRTSN